uniref:Exocyst component Exo84 C-terminal domain-containing protein n=1 Tax=Ditylenchus dipsaci TaxID=166011 RepID=A0A915CY08_9BILA
MATGDTSSSPFLKDNFNAPGYVNSFLEGVKPGEESKKLQSLRQTLNARNNQASETIKDIVFEHYKHFIETSKEISNLEREIYQLSTLLSEQKGLIENMMEMSGQDKKSSCNGSVHSSTSTAHNQLHSLMTKMDGVATILNNLKENERIVLQNQMTLLNADNMQPEHPILVVLLTNSLLIGYPTPNSKCPFHLVSNQPLDNLAAINFKSHNSSQEGEEHILQLLIFPEQIYVKCENARVKREWLEGIEQTKRRQEQEKSLVRQATIRAKRKSILGNIAKNNKNPQSLGELEEEGSLEEQEGKKPIMSVEDTQWLNDLISELQDVISHRHMEQAVEMLLEWKSCNCQDAAINAKFAGLERSVVKMLSDEVRRPGALHGGTRALSKPLSLLTSLNRPIFAIDLYLKRRSTFLRSNARDLTISEEPLSYVKQISSLFINEILDVTKNSKTNGNTTVLSCNGAVEN